MKTKLLILSAILAFACISCGKTESQNGKGTESSSAVENSESVKAPKNVDEINTVDEEATKKGNTPAYEVHVKRTDKDEKINEHTEIKNCFDDLLSTDEYMDSEYEYKYNSDGLMLEEKYTANIVGFSSNDIEYGTVNTYRYDEYGELASMNANYSEDTGTESRYENEYDNKGRLISTKTFLKYYGEIYEGSQDEEQTLDVTKYKYDKKGNLIETVSEGSLLGNTKTVFEYDSNGNIISELQTVIKDGEEKRGLDVYTTYNSRNLPETQDWFRSDELVWHYEFEYTFYNE